MHLLLLFAWALLVHAAHDSYIVILKPKTPRRNNAARRHHLHEHIIRYHTNDTRIHHRYEHGFLGYSFKPKHNHTLHNLRNDTNVLLIEPNGQVKVQSVESNPPCYNIDRVDQRSLPLDNEYNYPDSAGDGVSIFLLDTGINTAHVEFGGRASIGANFVDTEDDQDLNGHGEIKLYIIVLYAYLCLFLCLNRYPCCRYCYWPKHWYC